MRFTSSSDTSLGSVLQSRVVCLWNHWSRVVVSSFFIFNFFQLLATASLLKIIVALKIRQPYLVGKRVE